MGESNIVHVDQRCSVIKQISDYDSINIFPPNLMAFRGQNMILKVIYPSFKNNHHDPSGGY